MTDEHNGLTRRAFAATGLAAGFALAGGPVRADAIITDTKGLEAGEVSVPVADGVVPAYRARPAGAATAPLILVVQEIFGVHAFIRDVCRRFAKLGYYAIAPSLYARQGDPSRYGAGQTAQLVADIVRHVPDAQVMGDLDATLSFAAGDGGDVGRAGIVGFCWGGRIVWLYCAHSTKMRAGVAFYGPLTGEKNALRPLQPLDIAGDLKAPVLGNYGGQDKGIAPGNVAAMRSALTAAGKTNSRIDVYATAQHGFFADYRPSYDAADAANAWANTLAFFRAQGVR